VNRLLVLPLLALLSACVSYYQPESALQDGVYYAEDDPAYRYNADDYYSAIMIYPWASLDYLYFGYGNYPNYAYWDYPGYGFSFVYPNEPGFAPGFYAFYSPFYWRGYSTYYYPPVWRPYRNHCGHHGHCAGHDSDDPDAGDDRYAGNDGQDNGYPGGGGEENAFYSNNVKNKMGHAGYPLTRPYVSKTTAARNGYQGRVVKSYEPTRAKSAQPLAPGSAGVRPAVAGSARGARTAPSAARFSGHSRPAASFNPPSHSQSSGYGKSSRQRDRD